MSTPETLHFFVDEAGDPTLFDAKGRILVGQDGCSKTFIVGKLDVADPAALQVALEQLRADLLADPYFKRVPSMQAERGKTDRGPGGAGMKGGRYRTRGPKPAAHTA